MELNISTYEDIEDITGVLADPDSDYDSMVCNGLSDEVVSEEFSDNGDLVTSDFNDDYDDYAFYEENIEGNC